MSEAMTFWLIDDILVTIRNERNESEESEKLRENGNEDEEERKRNQRCGPSTESRGVLSLIVESMPVNVTEPGVFACQVPVLVPVVLGDVSRSHVKEV